MKSVVKKVQVACNKAGVRYAKHEMVRHSGFIYAKVTPPKECRSRRGNIIRQAGKPIEFLVASGSDSDLLGFLHNHYGVK